MRWRRFRAIIDGETGCCCVLWTQFMWQFNFKLACKLRPLHCRSCFWHLPVGAFRRCPGKTLYLLGQFFVRQILELRHCIFFLEKSKNKIHKFVKALFLASPWQTVQYSASYFKWKWIICVASWKQFKTQLQGFTRTPTLSFSHYNSKTNFANRHCVALLLSLGF